MGRLEFGGVIVGIGLCIIGLVIFFYSTSNINQLNAVSNMFLTVIGVFLGMAGLLVLMTNLFSHGSIFT